MGWTDSRHRVSHASLVRSCAGQPRPTALALVAKHRLNQQPTRIRRPPCASSCGTRENSTWRRTLPAALASASFPAMAACSAGSSAGTTSAIAAPRPWCSPTWPPFFAAWAIDVEYVLDRVPTGADLYVFNPSLITVPLERQAMAQALAEHARLPGAGHRRGRPLDVSEAFDGLNVTILQGRGGATVLEARRSAGHARADTSTWARSRPGPVAVSRLVAVFARTSSASATTSRSFPPALSSKAAAAR